MGKEHPVKERLKSQFPTVEGMMMRDGISRAEATQYANPQIQEMIRSNRLDIKIA